MEQGLFFPSKNGDRKYKASDFTGYFAKLFSNGVFSNKSTNLQVLASTTNGLSVIVQSGYGNINGYLYQLTENKTVLFNMSDVTGTAKKAAIVLRMDLNERKMTVEAKGTDILTRNEVIYELMLARISIPGDGKAITQTMIQDTRGDGTVCGYVSSLLDIDPTKLWIQFEADWKKWLAEIKGTVGNDAAANLALAVKDLLDKSATKVELIDLKSKVYTKEEITALNKNKIDSLNGKAQEALTITGEKGGTILNLRAINTTNLMNTYISFYKIDTRKAWIGFGSSVNDDFTISSETGNNVIIKTTGSGKVLYNNKEVAVVEDTGWIKLETIGVVPASGRSISYRKIGKQVFLRGGGNFPAEREKVFFTLPADVRPKQEVRFHQVTQDSAVNIFLFRVTTDGKGLILHNSQAKNIVTLDNISWMVD
ncbi:hypothetical protein ACWOFR_02555 [Carnobacterium gallinarum]|uniref:hypothetical protein n=1 Tax=Carnobacterium gallinarum TaxID=2749 RepID=UPI00068C00C7|nr:hypothetical protein [Carnobacterium gallinarum]